MQHPVARIVFAQLFGTSLWLSNHSAADDLIRSWGIGATDIGTQTNAVQLGFVLRMLGFSVTGLANQ